MSESNQSAPVDDGQAVTGGQEACTCGCSEMLWKWFEDESRIGADGMRPERLDGLSADDFKTMLDEHEAALMGDRSQSAGLCDIDITNHHNALKCPYCNPRGLKFADPHIPVGSAD